MTAPLSLLNGCVAKAARSNGAASTSAHGRPHPPDPHPASPSLRTPWPPSPSAPHDLLRWPEHEVRGSEGCQPRVPHEAATALPESPGKPLGIRCCLGETEAQRGDGGDCPGPPGPESAPPQGFPQPQFPVPFRGPPPRFSASSAQHLPLRFLERVRADFTPGSAGDPCPTTPAGWTDGGHRTTTHCLCLSLSLRGFQQEPSLVPCEHGCAPQLSPPNFVQDCPPHTLPAALKC